MHKQMENQKPPGVPDGGPAAEVVSAAPAKRQRRPNVRLDQPYYETPGHRKLQHQWKGFKKGVRKPRVVKALKNVKSSKESSNGGKSEEELNVDDEDGDDDDDDVAIGNWKNLRSKSRGKRVRPSGLRNWVSVESHANQDQENRILDLSSDDDDDADDDESGGHIKRDKNLGGNGVNGDFGPENSGPNRDRSSGDDNVGVNPETRRMGLSNCRNSGEIRDGEEDLGGNGSFGPEKSGPSSPNSHRSLGPSNPNSHRSLGGKRIMEEESDGNREMNGVKVWLNELGLGKYLGLFEVHEVDEEVLPLLTLDDLKDMGISAVGSRRRMYCSIQKLARGFS